MKVIQLPKKLLLLLMTHKKPILIGSAILCLSVAGATTYAYYRHQNTNTAAVSKAAAPAPEKQETPQTTSSTPAAIKNPDSAQSTPAPQSNPTPPTTANSPRNRPDPIQSQESPIFTAGRLVGAGVACYTGTYAYSLGSTTISVNTKTTQNFTWHVELNDGSIYRQGSSGIPYGNTVWQNFPSTPGFPDELGTIYNPSDGLKARLVITSPNYSAGGWSNPVPIGSSTSCHASPHYEGH
jgi:hypothetical protein